MDQEELELKERIKVLKQEELARRKQSTIEKKNAVSEKKQISTAIYVSNLPVSEGLQERLAREFSRFGMIAKDQDGNDQCKLYKNEKGELKGDALITYARHESVPVAIELMDGYNLEGSIIKVQVATFNNEKKRRNRDIANEGDIIHDSEKPTKFSKLHAAKTDEDSSNNNEHQERLARTVVITNIVSLIEELDTEELEDIKLDILQECKRIGPVEDVEWNESEGRADVLYQQQSDAFKCCNEMSGRLFDGKKLITKMGEEFDENSDLENDLFTEDDLIEL